jgi:hypothetical protein
MTDVTVQQGMGASDPTEEQPMTLFFNGESMPQHAQIWWSCVEPLHGIVYKQNVGWPDVSELVWGFESVGNIQSYPPAMFVYAIQELLLYAFEKETHVRKSLEANEPTTSAANDVFNALVSGALRMRSLTLAQRRAMWIVGCSEVDLPELVDELAAVENLPEDFPLQPHQREKISLLTSKLENQSKRFHQLAQSGLLSKELRRECHSMSVPDEPFLRLIF